MAPTAEQGLVPAQALAVQVGMPLLQDLSPKRRLERLEAIGVRRGVAPARQAIRAQTSGLLALAVLAEPQGKLLTSTVSQSRGFLVTTQLESRE